MSDSIRDGGKGERPTVAAVVLTQGKRPAELQRALSSLLTQTGVVLDVVVVGNGWLPVGLPEGVRSIGLPENVGIPAGRNAGVPHVSGEFLFFLDDDAWLLDDGFLETAIRLMELDPDIGLLMPEIEDPDSDDRPMRWIPALRVKGLDSGMHNVFSVVEMVLVARRVAFEAAGGWAGPFFYAHEGIELAWRIWGAGYRTVYAADLRAGHPVIDPRRHKEYFHMNARNRVWLARRNLPWPISWAYVATWTGVQLIRWWRHPSWLGAWFGGWWEGWRMDPWAPGEARAKLPWSAVIRMGRAGRVPVV